jgi:hypothetical protein
MEFLAILLFGIVVGWITYRTLARTTTSSINDISSVIGAVGGAAVMAFLDTAGRTATGALNVITPYCIGLFLGFFSYLVASLVSKKPLPFT